MPEPPSSVLALIPYRNGAALAGYYCAVFSIVPGIGLLLALPAIVLGVVGLVNARCHPENRGTVHAIVAIVVGLLGSYNYVGLYFLLAHGVN